FIKLTHSTGTDTRISFPRSVCWYGLGRNFFPQSRFIFVKNPVEFPAFFVNPLYNQVAVAVYIDMEGFVYFEYTFENSGLFFYRLRGNFKLVLNFNFFFFPISPIKELESIDHVRISEYLRFKLFTVEEFFFLKIICRTIQ